MPGRKTIFVTGKIYHVFNRGNAYRPIFLTTRDYRRFLKTINFYRYLSLPLRLSKYLILSKKRRADLEEHLNKEGEILVEIVSFCLMPNHYHFLLKQVKDQGISKYLSQIQNSYSRYFNIKKKRVGSIFQGRFKARRVETEEQFIHLSRYIHLNPYSSYVVKSVRDLKDYPWSSLPDYLGQANHSFVKKELVFNLFQNKKDYQNFVFDQADYQRELENIKHLVLDNK